MPWHNMVRQVRTSVRRGKDRDLGAGIQLLDFHAFLTAVAQQVLLQLGRSLSREPTHWIITMCFAPAMSRFIDYPILEVELCQDARIFAVGILGRLPFMAPVAESPRHAGSSDTPRQVPP